METAAEFNRGGVKAGLVGRRLEKPGREAHHKRGVALLQLPGTGHTPGNDLNVSVNGYSTMPLVTVKTSHACRRSGMNAHNGTALRRHLNQAGGIRQEADAEVFLRALWN